MAKSKKETPLMKQYNAIKQKYENTILLFRLGDFFETFGEDAIICAKVCGITLTKRNNGAAGEMPLAGFPYHQIDAYLPKLVRSGHRVAVCEQTEDPKKAKGIVKREVVEVVTPGVALYERILDAKSNNYICSIFLEEDKKGNTFAGIAYCDISTGEFQVSEIHSSQLINIIESVNPSEILIDKSQKEKIEPILKKLSIDSPITKLEDWIFDLDFAKGVLLDNFKTKSLKGFGIEDQNMAIISSGACLHYISETQKGSLEQINGISLFNPSDFMILDYPTRRNLEITYSNDGSGEGSLFNVIDKTCTPMGGRLLKKWVSRPIKNLELINSRLNSVEELFENYGERALLRKLLSELSDLERLNVKIATGRANPRDLSNIKDSLQKIPEINSIVSNFNSFKSYKLKEIPELLEILDNSLSDEAPANIGLGNVFKRGFNSELDQYLEAKFSGKNWIKNLQNTERERTGINSLKIGFNNVFGYYIDITKVHKDKVPEDYERRQTLTNSERYITPELKEIEQKILGAEEKIYALENRLFEKLRNEILQFSKELSYNAANISEIDCLQSYAQVSQENNYVKPLINNTTNLKIQKGRHPVVEKMLPIGDKFTDNDTDLDTEIEQIQIITGPNMSGKSCYLRQNALIVLLAQIGCFVPAQSAEIGLVDRIFTRVGAQDNITLGESTFLVEMQETANIINNATEKSLILLDEVGRGTATYDGLSIAWSIAEFIHDNTGAKTLFATHYHELNELENRFDRITNYRVEVIESMKKVIFTHKVRKGGSDHSFGIHVAKMAGLPKEITERANEIMRTFEADSDQKPIENIRQKNKPDTSKITRKPVNDNGQMAIFAFEDDKLRTKLRDIKIEELTPIKAFQLLAELIEETKK